MKALSLLLFTVIGLQGCMETSSKSTPHKAALWTPNALEQEGLKKAYFAAGCFWCVEAIYESVEGVQEVYSGYSGGHVKNPNYRQIGTGQTGHAEAVEILYDPTLVNFETLVKVFFGSHDPTTLNRQGPDKGTQYRSIAFYQNQEEQKVIENYVNALESKKEFANEIVTQIKPFEKFYYAEEYHQNYEKRNPNNPYVQNVSIPRLRSFQNKFPELLKKDNH